MLELVDDDRSGAYRAIYTVKFENEVYVLHAFQKKSKKGRKTAKHDIEVIRQRLRAAEKDYREGAPRPRS